MSEAMYKTVTPEADNAPPAPKSARQDASGRAFAEVEKWLAMIREINRESAKS